MPAKRRRASAAEPDLSAADEDVDDAPAAPQAECPFTIEYRAANLNLPGSKRSPNLKGKKAKKANARPPATVGPPPEQHLDQTLPEDNLMVYSVKPKLRWDALKKYRNFVVGSETFALNDYIFVNHGNIAAGVNLTNVDDKKFWVARVLEIRAVDEAHVYLRVYWMYWPEELPGGRQYYHGYNELISSNHMEIVDAMTVSGRANVKHWLELDEDEDLPDLFWRQRFDFPSQSLLEVREHCRCHRYYNPDTIMIGCGNCHCWLHEDCLIEEVQRQVIDRGRPADAKPLPSASAPAAATPPTQPPTSPAPAESPAKKRATKGVLAGALEAHMERSAASPSTTPAPAAAPEPFSSPAPASSSKPPRSAKRSKAAHVQAEREEMAQIDVKIIPQTGCGPARAKIRDRRPVAIAQKRAEAQADENGVTNGDGDGEAAETKVKREDDVLEWEEDVRCLLCNIVIE